MGDPLGDIFGGIGQFFKGVGETVVNVVEHLPQEIGHVAEVGLGVLTLSPGSVVQGAAGLVGDVFGPSRPTTQCFPPAVGFPPGYAQPYTSGFPLGVGQSFSPAPPFGGGYGSGSWGGSNPYGYGSGFGNSKVNNDWNQFIGSANQLEQDLPPTNGYSGYPSPSFGMGGLSGGYPQPSYGSFGGAFGSSGFGRGTPFPSYRQSPIGMGGYPGGYQASSLGGPPGAQFPSYPGGALGAGGLPGMYPQSPYGGGLNGAPFPGSYGPSSGYGNPLNGGYPPSFGGSPSAGGLQNIFNGTTSNMCMEDKVQAVLTRVSQGLDQQIEGLMGQMSAASAQGNSMNPQQSQQNMEQLQLQLQKLVERRQQMFTLMTNLSEKNSMKWPSLPSRTWGDNMSRLIKNEEGGFELSLETVQNLVAFAQGKMTWAEAEGMTWEQAKAIGQVGCDLAEAGRLDEARVLFEGLIAGNPKDSASLAALGTVYQKLGRIQDAKQAYSQTLEVDPENPIALTYRGELRLREKDQSGLDDIVRATKADQSGITKAGRRARALLKALSNQSPMSIG